MWICVFESCPPATCSVLYLCVTPVGCPGRKNEILGVEQRNIFQEISLINQENNEMINYQKR